MYGGFATPEAFRSLRSLHPLDSRKTIAKRKEETKSPPFILYTRGQSLIAYGIAIYDDRFLIHNSNGWRLINNLIKNEANPRFFKYFLQFISINQTRGSSPPTYDIASFTYIDGRPLTLLNSA